LYEWNADDCCRGAAGVELAYNVRIISPAGGICLHSAESEYNTHSYLLFRIHLQLLHDEDWNDTQCPIRGAGQRRVAVERVYDEFRGNAVAFAAAKLFPEERDRPALECEEEEEVHAVNLDDDQGNPNNGAVNLFNGDTQQKNADAGFEENVRSDVGGLAGPPPLITVVSVVDVL
jgi:hypothetical protein